MKLNYFVAIIFLLNILRINSLKNFDPFADAQSIHQQNLEMLQNLQKQNWEMTQKIQKQNQEAADRIQAQNEKIIEKQSARSSASSQGSGQSYSYSSSEVTDKNGKTYKKTNIQYSNDGKPTRTVTKIEKN